MKRTLTILLTLCLLPSLLCGCGSGGQKAADALLGDIAGEITAELQLADAAALSEEMLFSLYGIAREDYEEMAAFQVMHGIFPDECVMVRCPDAAAAERVAAQLQQRLDQVLVQSRSYDAAGYAAAQSCQVRTEGVYVSLFLSARHEEMEALYDAHFRAGITPPPAPVPTATPSPTPLPTPEPTPSPTPEPDWPACGLVPERERAEDAWFDDVIFVGDSVEYMLTQYVLRQRSYGQEGCMGTATLFAASNFSYHLAVDESGDRLYFPLYNGTPMTVEEAVVASGAKKLLLGMGTNDIALLGLDRTMANVALLMDRVRAAAPDVRVFLMGMAPRPAGYDNSDLSNALIREFNDRLLRYAEEQGYYYLDTFAALSDENGVMPDDYCADLDGQAVHPNSNGCAVWLEYLYDHTIPD